jgi:hypothetical protein
MNITKPIKGLAVFLFIFSLYFLLRLQRCFYVITTYKTDSHYALKLWRLWYARPHISTARGNHALVLTLDKTPTIFDDFRGIDLRLLEELRRTSLLGFAIYLFQKFEHFFASFHLLLFSDSALSGANTVHHYHLFLFVVNYWVDVAAKRSVSMNLAAALFNIIKNAIAAVISKGNVAARIKPSEKRS